MTRIRSLRFPVSVPVVAIVAGALTAAAAAPGAAQAPAAPPVQESPPAAPGARSSALAEIDRVAARAAALVRKNVPDRAGAPIWLLPFVTDTGVTTRLGHRLQSAVHLRLLRGYRSAQIRVVERRPLPFAAAADVPRSLPAGATSARYALELEIQPFRDTLRVVLRMLGSGTVIAGEWVDLPVNEELQDLLDGAGAAAGRWQRATEPYSGAPPGAEPEPPRAPLPSAITVDRGQQRYTTGGEDWVTVQVPEPGFYLLEGRSLSGPLTLSLHHERDGPPVVTARENSSSGAGGDDGLPRGMDRMLGLFSGPRRSYLRITTASGDDVAYFLRLRPMNPSRRFADGTVYAVPLQRGTGFQTLRVFRSGIYRVVADASAAEVGLRVFSVPHMRSVTPVSAAPLTDPGTVETGTRQYELPAGDYLVEVTAPATRTARMCWADSDSTGGCAVDSGRRQR